MTDVRITGISRVIHRDGPGPLRLTGISRVIHRTPTALGTRVKIVGVTRVVHVNGVVGGLYPRILVF